MTPADPNKRPDKSVQSYFRKIHRDYQESVGRETIAGVHERIRSKIEPRLQGLVLDIGSGGVPDHETNASRTVISLDNVFEFFKNAKGKNVLNVVGDIRALPLKRNAMDRIIIQFVIHHLTESILEKNLGNVRNALAESARVLNINWGTMNEASQALFPWLRFPLKYTPVRCTLISAVKA
jgi:SAM-dependent methyltransferase